MEIVTINYAEIQKVKSNFVFENSILSIRICNKFRFFDPRFYIHSLLCLLNDVLQRIKVNINVISRRNLDTVRNIVNFVGLDIQMHPT